MTETLSNVLVESYRTLFLRAFLSLLIPELDGGLLAPPPTMAMLAQTPTWSRVTELPVNVSSTLSTTQRVR